jgi:hypothetical protein
MNLLSTLFNDGSKNPELQSIFCNHTPVGEVTWRDKTIHVHAHVDAYWCDTLGVGLVVMRTAIADTPQQFDATEEAQLSRHRILQTAFDKLLTDTLQVQHRAVTAKTSGKVAHAAVTMEAGWIEEIKQFVARFEGDSTLRNALDLVAAKEGVS